MKSFIKHIFFLLKNELKRTYSGSIIGTAWFIINPILYASIYYLLFEKIIQVKFSFKVTHVSYFQYLIIGLILWNSFTSGVLRGSTSIIENAYILKKVFIKPEYFPIVYTLMYALQGFLLILILVILLKAFYLTLLIILPIAFMSFYFFILGISFILAALTVYIRDIPQLLNNIMNFIFYTVPIIYPYEYIPKNLEPFISLNPIFYIFKPFYDILFYKNLEINTLILSLIISFSVFLFGFILFQKLKEGFYDVL